MTPIKYYMVDGAKAQEQVILAMMRYHFPTVSEIVRLLPDNNDHVRLVLEVGRYENCREQGYVFTMRDDKNYHAIANYCVFEHRNSDDICLIKFDCNSCDTPSVETIWAGRKDKWDIDFSVECGHFHEMTEHIIDDMTEKAVKYANAKIANNEKSDF